MAKLYFKYGAMGSSKTANALITKFNYEERGMKVWLLKPATDDRDGQDGQPPAGGGVGHGGGGQVQADEDNDGAGDHGGQEVHHAVHAHSLDDGGEDHIQQAGDDDAAAGILQFFRRLHRGVHAGA